MGRKRSKSELKAIHAKSNKKQPRYENSDKYVATAIDKRKGYRAHISKRFDTKEEADQFVKKYKKDYKDAIPKYQFFSDWKVEKTK